MGRKKGRREVTVSDMPKDRVLFQEGRADMVACIIAFDAQPQDYHWAGFHRNLQQTFKANFPTFHRKSIKYRGEKHCYSFLGFRNPKY